MTIVTCRNPADIRRETNLAAKSAAPKPSADTVPHPVVASTPHHLKLTDGGLEAPIKCLDAVTHAGWPVRQQILDKAKALRRVRV